MAVEINRATYQTQYIFTNAGTSAIVASSLLDELHWSESQVGQVQSAFFVGYALTQVFGGLLGGYQNENEQQEERLERESLIRYGVILFLVLVMILTFFVFKNYIKNKKIVLMNNKKKDLNGNH